MVFPPPGSTSSPPTCTISALQIARAYRTGESTPIEAVEHYLGEIEARNAHVGAFVTLTATAARAAAELATTTLRLAEPGTLPPMYGVPTGIKDLNATAGVRTMYGSAAMTDVVPTCSDEVALRIERAGMISLGKTNTPELGSPCYTEPDVGPPARTPYGLSLSAGGSSGGAAAAVASGLLPVAQGSDGGGSIRIPASVCGLVGLKTSRSRISAAPTYADVTGLGVPGPLAGTVRDAAALLDVLAGPAPGDALWARPLPTGQTYLLSCDQPPGRLRVARFAVPVIADTSIDPEVLAAYQDISDRLVDLGHDVVDIDVPIPPTVVPAFETVWAVSTAMVPVPADREALLRPLTRWLRAKGAATSGPEFARALAAMQQAAGTATALLSRYDLVLTPTLAKLPARVGGLRDDADPAADFEAQKAFTPFTSAWNVTGMPAISLPTGWSATGLPIGMMLATRPCDEHVLCSVGAQLETSCSTEANPWNRPEVARP